MLAWLSERLKKRESNPFFAGMPGNGPVKRYLIATTGRTGSTLLCSRIAEYGGLGFPNEFLNESYIAEFDRLFPNPSLADFEHYVGHAFSSSEGVFGLKTDWWRFQKARQLELFRSLYEPLDLIVHLKREDFVGQAVSLALAMETQVWHTRDLAGSNLENRHAGLDYKASEIKAHARNILNQEYHWRRYFAEAQVPLMELTYEELSGDVDKSIRSIAEAFDLRLAPRNARPVIEKARSSVAEAWHDRFLEECEDFVSFWREHRGRLSAA